MILHLPGIKCLYVFLYNIFKKIAWGWEKANIWSHLFHLAQRWSWLNLEIHNSDCSVWVEKSDVQFKKYSIWPDCYSSLTNTAIRLNCVEPWGRLLQNLNFTTCSLIFCSCKSSTVFLWYALLTRFHKNNTEKDISPTVESVKCVVRFPTVYRFSFCECMV